MIALDIHTLHEVHNANYVTFIEPKHHPDRIMHQHDFLYMIDGNWEIYENDEKYKISSGDLLILAAGRHHYGELCSANNHHMFIHCIPTAEESCSSNAPHSHVYNGNLITFPSLIHCQNSPAIPRLFDEIIHEEWGLSIEKDQKKSLYFQLLLCELKDLIVNNHSAINDDHIVYDAIKLIESNPHKIYSCKEMANTFFICERTLSNYFKQIYGKSFYAYQMDLKLAMVHRSILDRPDILLSEVARNHGFYDEYHLSKAFKKKYGISPRHLKQ